MCLDRFLEPLTAREAPGCRLPSARLPVGLLQAADQLTEIDRAPMLRRADFPAVSGAAKDKALPKDSACIGTLQLGPDASGWSTSGEMIDPDL